MRNKPEVSRLEPNAGIAFAPILFIIAILAILAAAIAAGRGSLTVEAQTEHSKTQAAALIQIGENLKIGADRVIMGGRIKPAGTAGATVLNTVSTATSDPNDLFSPSGGGISAPSVAMANDPASDVWYYVSGPISGLGTGGATADLFAVLRVSQTTCAAVNNVTVGTNSAPTGADLGNFSSGATVAANTVTNWATMTSPSLSGVSTGCVNNTNADSKGYYFYQVMAIQ